MNFARSSVIVVGEVPNRDQLTADLGCRMGQLLISYVGLPHGAMFKRKEV